MKGNIELSIPAEKDLYRLVIIGSVFFLFLAIYVSYSAAKFGSIAERALVKNSVVMKVIQHNVLGVCPKCGSKGIPRCPTCSVDMFWNGYKGSFVCAACGKGGFPACPRCGTFMTWIEAR
ncbi:MAG: hypothetical protein HQL30_09515 [Candidatus Omnitrophica bacterium]|nr:hypothetical protein [Candidatus Omnitrophota bacterium]